MQASEITSASVLAWAQRKPRDEEYPYASSSACIFAQYLKENGITETPSVGVATWSDKNDTSIGGLIPADVDDAACRSDNFGEFCDRLTEALV